MSISIYKINKWYKMIIGKSISHVNQGVGTCYSKTKVSGYYNDLTEKVTKDNPDILIPEYYVDTGEKTQFAIGIFQYGLASYDLFLKTGNIIYKNKFLACSEWAVSNLQDDGSWKTFEIEHPKHPYSSMAQGEGISLLIRAHIVTQEKRYMVSICKAINFMLKPISDGGVACYSGADIYFFEYTNEPLVLNGWIFSIWGLYDYCKYTNDSEVQTVLNKTLISLKRKLADFDIKYWSMYDDGKRICSPFYHKLHIAQLRAMYDLFGDQIYNDYAEKWEKYQNSFLKPKIAFIKKTFQKVMSKD